MKKLYTKRIILLLIFAGVLGFFLGFVSNGTTEIKLPYYEEWDEYDCVYGEITDFQHKSESDRVEEVTTIYCPIEGNKVFQYPLLESCFQYVTIYGATYIDDDKVQVTQLSYPKLIINLNFLSDKKMMDMYSECTSPYFMMGPNTQSISEELWENADANQEKYVKAVFDYISNMEYDYAKVDAWDANKRWCYQRNRMNIDEVIIKQSGICIEKANCMAAMLRYQGIPCKVCLGYYVDDSEEWHGHAWNSVFFNDSWFFCDATNGNFDDIEEFQKYELYWCY